MKWIIGFVGGFLFFIAIKTPVHAIVFLPAIILIPIAKIVAVIITGFSVPVVGGATVWSKLFNKSLKRTLIILLIIFLLLGICLAFFLKLHNPDRPWI